MQLSVKAFDTDEMFVIILQYTIVPSDKCLKTLWQQTVKKQYLIHNGLLAQVLNTVAASVPVL